MNFSKTQLENLLSRQGDAIGIYENSVSVFLLLEEEVIRIEQETGKYLTHIDEEYTMSGFIFNTITGEIGSEISLERKSVKFIQFQIRQNLVNYRIEK